MTPAEKAYQDWVDEGDNRYGSVHRKAFEAGYKAGGMIEPLGRFTEEEVQHLRNVLEDSRDMLRQEKYDVAEQENAIELLNRKLLKVAS